MLQNSQRDRRWANELIGTSKTETIAKSGCYISSLANLMGLTPSEVNKILTEKKAYVNKCEIGGVSAAKALGLTYGGKTSQKPLECEICIAETDHYAKLGVKSHFFLYCCSDGFILDPYDLNPVFRDNNYKIVSFRLFKLKPMDKLNKAIKLLGELWAKNPDKQKEIHESADDLRAIATSLGIEIIK